MAKGRIEIAEEYCKSCEYCVVSCPQSVIAVGDKVNSKGYPYVIAAYPDKCVGCAMCAQVCPEAAIEVWR